GEGTRPGKLAPGEGTRGVSARGPSRPRPWPAVGGAQTVGGGGRGGRGAGAETAGSAGSGGRVTGGSRGCHGFGTGEPRIRHRTQASSQRPWEVHGSSRVVPQSRARCPLSRL